MMSSASLVCVVSPERCVRPPAVCQVVIRACWWSLWAWRCVEHWTLSRWAPCRAAVPSHHTAHSPGSLQTGSHTGERHRAWCDCSILIGWQTHLQQPCRRSEARCKTETLQDISLSPHWRCNEATSVSCLSTLCPAAEHKHTVYNKTGINLMNLIIIIISSSGLKLSAYFMTAEAVRILHQNWSWMIKLFYFIHVCKKPKGSQLE